MGEGRPYEISSAQGWSRHPDKVWAWYCGGTTSCRASTRTTATEPWQRGRDHAEVHVVTQNVDNLHERAGSRHVYHLHGSLFEFRCDRCQREYVGRLPDMPEPVETVPPPQCSCGGLIRPNVVWFGEPLPDAEWRKSVEAVSNADVVIVVGTSSIVYPAAGLPETGAGQRHPGDRGQPRAHAVVGCRDGLGAGTRCRRVADSAAAPPRAPRLTRDFGVVCLR